MEPSELSKTLRRIASAINKSRNPDRALVARDLKKIIAAIAPVTVKEFVYETGDKRRYGSFHVFADTSLGELVGHGLIDSGGGTEKEVWTLNGKPIDETIDYPDLGIPHSYAGNRALARFEKTKDTEIPEILAEWISDLTRANTELGI